MNQRLVLVRHGETEWSKVGRHTGRTDIPLTAAGETEAQLVGETLASWSITSSFSSPLQRAVTTASLAGFDPRIDPDLMEWDYGEVEGQTNDDYVRTHPNWSKWDDPVPAGEQVQDVGRRADAFLERIVSESTASESTASESTENIAVFAHGHFLSILIARWLDLSARQGRCFPLATGSLSVLTYKRADRVIEMVNHAC